MFVAGSIRPPPITGADSCNLFQQEQMGLLMALCKDTIVETSAVMVLRTTLLLQLTIFKEGV